METIPKKCCIKTVIIVNTQYNLLLNSIREILNVFVSNHYFINKIIKCCYNNDTRLL